MQISPRGNKLTPEFKQGFTLFEVLVVIIILGALASMVLPSFSVSRNQAEAEAFNIQKFIETHRTLAMESTYPTFLSIDFGTRKLSYVEKNSEDIADKEIAEKDSPLPSYIWDKSSKISLTTASETNFQSEEISPLIPLYKDGRNAPFILEITDGDHIVKLVYNGTRALGQIERGEGK